MLELSFTSSESGGFLSWLSGGQWINARDGNIEGTNNPLYNEQFLGSFAEFQLANPGGNLSNFIGAWGVDAEGDTTSVWAVLNHNSNFAIVPEPPGWVLAGLSILGLLVLRRRRGTSEP